MSKTVRNRPRWVNNMVYILAAIGCAAGLGNLWRFPMLAYEYGGASFIIALLISNIIIIYPLLMTETIIGQEFQQAAPQCMDKLKRGTSWMQWIAVFTMFFILSYYVPVMAWAIKYLFSAFNGNFLNEPSSYFVTNIIHLTDGIQTIGQFQWIIFFCLILAYGIVLYSLRKNVHSLSSVVKITAIAPFVLLLIMIVRGVTLPGAMTGLRELLVPNWSELLNIKLWQEAVAQSFFSASVGLGYFYVAGSHRNHNDEVPKASILILAGNFLVSILSGIAVFSTIGFMAYEKGVPVSEAATGGPMLVFSVLPTAISMMPFLKITFAVILFLIIITLAIDSIFGIMEVVVGAFHDWFEKYSYLRVLTVISGLVLLAGIPYLFGAGLYYLDIIDHFLSGYFLLLSGLMESIMAAYIVGPERIRNWINNTAKEISIGKFFNYIMYLIPLVLVTLIIVNLTNEFKEIYSGYPVTYIIGFGAIPMISIIVLTAIFGIITSKK